MKYKKLFKLFIVLTLLLFPLGAFAENIDPDNDNSQYAYGENVGWLNAEPSGDGGQGVEVHDSNLTGYLWGENIGWISLSCENTSNCGTVDYGVINDGDGNLTGYAWGENIGWISFSCENTSSCGSVYYGVFIDPGTGEFSGHAWGENIGWVTFRSTGSIPFGVTTSWPEDLCEGNFDNDTDVDGSDLAEFIANSDLLDYLSIFAGEFGRTDCP